MQGLPVRAPEQAKRRTWLRGLAAAAAMRRWSLKVSVKMLACASKPLLKTRGEAVSSGGYEDMQPEGETQNKCGAYTNKSCTRQ